MSNPTSNISSNTDSHSMQKMNVPQDGNQDQSSKKDDQPIVPVPTAFTLIQHTLQNTQIPREVGTQGHQDPNIISPNDSLDDIFAKVISNIRQQMTTMREMNPGIANTELPTASIPSFLTNANRPRSNGSTYNPLAPDSLDGVLEYMTQSFKVEDYIQEGLANFISTIRSTASGSESPNHVPLPFMGSAVMAIRDAIPNPQSPSQAKQGNEPAIPLTDQPQPQPASPPSSLPPGFGIRDVVLNIAMRGYWTSETLLRLDIHHLLRHLSTVQLPEDDDTYPLHLSTLGFLILHLYEVTWDDAILDVGLGGTGLALGMLRGGLHTLVYYAPTLVRSWSYGQRLLFQRDGDVEKLNNAVSIIQSLGDIYEQVSEMKGRVKTFLGTELALCLLDKYRSTGSLDELNSSIDHLHTMFKESHTDWSIGLALGMAFYERFLHCGNTEDLDNALHHGLQASGYGKDSSTPEYDTDKAAGSYLFAVGLSERFKATLDVKDLDRAVKQCRKAVDCLHPSHPLRPYYKSSLALILYARYEANKDRKDMESALHIIQTAVGESKVIIGRHLHVPLETIQGYLTVMSLDTNTANIPLIKDGIRMITKSRKAFSGAAHIESRIESYLSKSFLHLFHASRAGGGNLSEFDLGDDFDSALDHATLAFEKAPEDSPSHHQFGLDMGRLLLKQYETGYSSNFDEAIARFYTTALSSTWPSIRIEAAIQLANALDSKDPAGALDALQVALDILPSFASLGECMPTQYQILSKQQSSIPQRAAMYAMEMNDLVMAVSCLEKGRNIMWAQALQLRAGHMLPAGDARQKEFKLIARHLLGQRQVTPRTVQELEESWRHLPPDHVDQTALLLELAQPFMSVYSTMMKQLVELNGEEQVNRDFAMQQEFRDDFKDVYSTAALHGSAKRWNDLLSDFDELRGVLSFDEETRKDLVSILRKANGSVLVLNVCGARCDGIVISAVAEAEELTFHHIPFVEVSADQIHAWAEGLREGMEVLHSGHITVDRYESDCLFPVLRGLWRGVASPILEHFAEVTAATTTKRRVWWYPTGQMAFVPVHAASPCEHSEPGLLDLVISSYIPSIHSLIRASKAPPQPLKILAVGQPETPGLSRLPYAEKEINALKRLLRESPERLTILMGEEGKIYPVISSIPNHTGLHISCHAHQDEQYPFNSAFYFHNGPLKLSKVMSLDLMNVQFAFLSACLTSAGDAALPDESIHLAAGMQFAGVGSVVATMWSVEDRVSAAVSSRVYGHLLRNGAENADTRQSAEALHEAMAAVKKAGTPLTFIVPFIHLGI